MRSIITMSMKLNENVPGEGANKCVYLRTTPKSSRCPPFPIRVLFSLLNLMLIVSLCIYIYSQRRVVRRTEAYVTVCGQPIE